MTYRKWTRKEGIDTKEFSMGGPTLVIRYDDPLAVFVVPSISLELFPEQPTLFDCMENEHTDETDDNI